VEDALDLLAAASEEALARGNSGIAAEIDAVAATLRAKGPGIAQAAQAAYDPLSSVTPPSVPPPEVEAPIRDEFAAARRAIAEGFGSIKAALADPPQLISRADRLANMEARFRKVMRNLREAVRKDDPFAVSYWTEAAVKQQDQMDRMRRNTSGSVKDVRRTFREAGVDIGSTWLAVQKGAERTERKVAGVGAAIEALPDRKTIRFSTPGLAQAASLLATLGHKLSDVERGAAISIALRDYGGGVLPRQHGGPVRAGLPYLVGEVRPELFIPEVAGRIEPRPTSLKQAEPAAGSSTTVNLQTYGLPMRAETPREVVAQLRRAARMGVLEPRRQPAWARP